MANKYLGLEGIKVILNIMDEKDTEIKKLIPTDYCTESQVDKKISDAVLDGVDSIDLSDYAKKTDLHSPYDDTALKNRVTALENKPDKDTVYDDTSIKNRLTALESKTDKDTIYDDTVIKARISALEAREDKDTVYDDTEIKNRLDALESDTDSAITEDEIRALLN